METGHVTIATRTGDPGPKNVSGTALLNPSLDVDAFTLRSGLRRRALEDFRRSFRDRDVRFHVTRVSC